MLYYWDAPIITQPYAHLDFSAKVSAANAPIKILLVLSDAFNCGLVLVMEKMIEQVSEFEEQQ